MVVRQNTRGGQQVNTEVVEIIAGSTSYQAMVGEGLIDRAGDLLTGVMRGRRCAIIADTNSAPMFAQRLELSLAAAGFAAERFTMPAGEQSKTLVNVGRICDEMIAAGFDRSAFGIGLGGGVVGDVSGFVAAIFSRGIAHVQVPTTLLAMVDSAIGGKCGVNASAGKNLLGAIHQPRLILADTSTLTTLPDRELRQGMAEVVKHAIIRDATMFGLLRDTHTSSRAERSEVEGPRGVTESTEARGTTGSPGFARDDLSSLIKRNIEIKAGIVESDERETSGARAVLNFGHTIGHAIERAANYELLRHGEAISIGMVAACNVSMKRAGFSERERDDVIALLNSLKLPTQLPATVSREAVFDAVRFDKKFQDGEVRFVVTPRIGEAFLSKEVTLEDIREAIERL